MNKFIFSSLICFVFPSVSLGMYHGIDYADSADSEKTNYTPMSASYNSTIRRKLQQAPQYNAAEFYFQTGIREYQKKTFESYNTSFDNFQKAATMGHAMAQHNLAAMYEKGLGTPIDFALAKKWYSEAEKNGNSSSKKSLKRIYEKEEYLPYKILGIWVYESSSEVR